MKKDISPWRILFYFSMAVLTLWLILKSAGIIHTPFWLEYGVPIGSVVLSVFAIYHDIIKTINKTGTEVHVLKSEVSHFKTDVKNDISKLNTDISKLNIDINRLNTEMTVMHSEIDNIKTNVSYINRDIEIIKEKLYA